MQQWTVEDSVDLYGIRNWSTGYFDISSKGEVVIRPFAREGGPEVSVLEIINELKDRGYDGALTIEREISGDEQIRDILSAKALLEKLLEEA